MRIFFPLFSQGFPRVFPTRCLKELGNSFACSSLFNGECFPAMSEVLQDQHTNPMGMPVKETSLKNALLNGTEKASMEEAGDILSGLKDARPIIEVPAGTSIYVLIGEGNE